MEETGDVYHSSIEEVNLFTSIKIFFFRERPTLEELFRHHGRVVVSNLPLATFIDVHVGVSGLHYVSLTCKEGEKMRKDPTWTRFVYGTTMSV